MGAAAVCWESLHEIPALVVDEIPAFRALYDRHHRQVYALGFRTCGNAADAEEVVQKTFLRVLRGLPGFRGEGDLAGWIHRIALRVALTEVASRRSDTSLEGTAEPEAPADPGKRLEQADLLEHHLTTLEPRERALLHLRCGEGRSYEEIAALMEMPVGTAKTLIFRAKALLRRRMEASDAL